LSFWEKGNKQKKLERKIKIENDRRKNVHVRVFVIISTYEYMYA